MDRRQELVARRIEELQASNKRKAEIAAMTRDELIGILTEIVHANRARLSEARQADGLNATEMLSMKWGWKSDYLLSCRSMRGNQPSTWLLRSLPDASFPLTGIPGSGAHTPRPFAFRPSLHGACSHHRLPCVPGFMSRIQTRSANWLFGQLQCRDARPWRRVDLLS